MKSDRLLLAIVACAVVIRLISFVATLTVGAGEAVLVEDDAGGYVSLASHLVAGDGFVTLNETTGLLEPERFRSIGLPLLLVPFMFVSHGVVWWGVFLSIVAGIALPLLVYAIGRRLFTEYVALGAAAATAVEPHLVWFSWLPLTEIPFILCAFGALWLLIRVENPSWLSYVGAGLLLGYSILLRPPYLFVFAALLLCVAIWYVWHRRYQSVLSMAVLVIGMILILAPWSIRNMLISGSPALSGMGWYNVYVDYLASVRSVDNATLFTDEKEILRSNPPAGMTRDDLMNPAFAGTLRTAALAELWERRATVVALETAALFSFFTNDGYFYYLEEFGLIPRASEKGLEHSITFAVLSGGSAGSAIVHELQRQYFIPLFGRALTLGILLLALIGVVTRRDSWTLFFSSAILLTALVSTAVGLGVQARLRVPVQPFLFLLAGTGVVFLLRMRCAAPILTFVRLHGAQIIRFCISGGTAATAGALTVYLLTDIGGLWYLFSSIVSFVVATIIAFSLQKYWTFRERSTHRIPIQTTQGLALVLFNSMMNIVLIYILVDVAHIHYVLAQCLVYALIGAIDFFVYKFVIFKQS